MGFQEAPAFYYSGCLFISMSLSVCLCYISFLFCFISQESAGCVWASGSSARYVSQRVNIDGGRGVCRMCKLALGRVFNESYKESCSWYTAETVGRCSPQSMNYKSIMSSAASLLIFICILNPCICLFFVVCAFRHTELLKFLEDNDWVVVAECLMQLSVG